MDYRELFLDNFNALKEFDENLAKKLLDDVGEGDWMTSDLTLYPTLNDFAKYEVIDGWYMEVASGLNGTSGAPSLLYYIDYDALGEELARTWNDSVYWTDGTRVITTSYGW